MKYLIHNGLKFFFKVFSVFYSYQRSRKLYRIRSKIFSYWAGSSFKSIGVSASLSYPLTLTGLRYITAGNNVTIAQRGIVTAWDAYQGSAFTPEIIFGNNVSIGEDCHITAINSIRIGDNVLMGKKVTITDNSHGRCVYSELKTPPVKRKLHSKGAVIICSGVWIGDKVTVLPGVTIGENAIIGANSVVTRNIPANVIAGGIPAVILKKISK